MQPLPPALRRQPSATEHLQARAPSVLSAISGQQCAAVRTAVTSSAQRAWPGGPVRQNNSGICKGAERRGCSRM
jgi:hypothetical protein